jgi:hypothetical protein
MKPQTDDETNRFYDRNEEAVGAKALFGRIRPEGCPKQNSFVTSFPTRKLVIRRSLSR